MGANACACVHACQAVRSFAPPYPILFSCFGCPVPKPPIDSVDSSAELWPCRGVPNRPTVLISPGDMPAYCMCEWRAEDHTAQPIAVWPSPCSKRGDAASTHSTIVLSYGIGSSSARWIRQCPNRTGLWLRANITSMWLRHPPTIGTCVA